MQSITQFQHVPAFDGRDSSFLDYEQRATLWNRATDIPPEKKSTLLISHMGPTARQVRPVSGGDTLMQGDDVMAVAHVLRNYFQPDAVGHIFKQVGKFMVSKRTDQPIEKFPMEINILRRRAEKHVFPNGGGFPAIYTSS